MQKKKIIISLMLLVTTFLFADKIEFEADYTYAKLEDKNRIISLEGNAQVKTEGLVLKSGSIKVIGEDSNTIVCEDNVKIYEEKQKLKLFTQKLNYYKKEELLNIDNWVYIEDEKNNLIATCGSLLYLQKEGLMKLSMDVTIFKNTKDGLLICNAQILEFNRDKEELTLKGNAQVDLDNNKYNAAIIKVDLKTNNIILDGNINATVET